MLILNTPQRDSSLYTACEYGIRDGSIRTFRTNRTDGIYGRLLEAMYGTGTRISALEGCLAALRCGASV
eukprot:364018-Chlamydomonas_euryale.AAC.7